MNEGDDDGFGGLALHSEVGIGAANVPRHALTGFNVGDLARLHGGVGGDERRVDERDVP